MHVRIEILGLHDGHAAVAAHHPAIGAGIGQVDGDKGQISLGLHGLGDKGFQACGGDERRIAIDHEDIGETRRDQPRQGRSQGVTRAALFGLEHEGLAPVRKGGRDQVGPVADHGQQPIAAHRGQGLTGVPKHGPVEKPRQHLGGIGLHARALAGGKNQRANALFHDHSLAEAPAHRAWPPMAAIFPVRLAS